METYLAIYKKMRNSRIRYVFLDSFKFLNTSFDDLVSLLDKRNDFNILKNNYTKNLDLLMRKSFLPYDYLSSVEKCSETSLPEQKYFYNFSHDENISDENYRHVQKIWNSLPEKYFS